MVKLPKYVFWIAVIFCWPSMLLAADPVAPLHVHERDEVTVKLMPGPCVDPTTVMLIAMNVSPELQAKFRAIESNWLMRDGSRRDYAGCWLETGDDFLLIFSDATGTRISKARFNRRKGMVDS